jgi:hypothetical protein
MVNANRSIHTIRIFFLIFFMAVTLISCGIHDGSFFVYKAVFYDRSWVNIVGTKKVQSWKSNLFDGE